MRLVRPVLAEKRDADRLFRSEVRALFGKGGEPPLCCLISCNCRSSQDRKEDNFSVYC
jgi:hypothetical protein